MTWRASLLVAALAATAAPTLVHAQTPDNNGNGNNNDNNGGRRNRGGNGGDNNGGGGGGGRRNFDPAQMQQRVMDALKEQMNPADDEWKVIEPKLTKLLEAQRDVQNGAGNVMRLAFGGGRGGPGGGGPGGGGQGGQGGGGNRGGPGGGGPGGGPPSNTELGRAATDLHTATEADGTSPEDLEKKVTAFRTARTNATTKLEGARKDLKDVLTPKQEAVLLYYGLLE